MRKLMAFAGPGFMVAVGYMDPGNWATDLAGGSKFGYSLLAVIFLSNLIAIVLQGLCVKLGIVTGKDLAQACRDHYSRPVGIALWVIAELAIAACDLAEVIGSAIALQLLFGLPLLAGVLITVLDVFLVLLLNRKGFRYIEAVVVGLIGVIAVSLLIDVFWAKPDWGGLLMGFIPTTRIITNPEMLYIAIGILGATVMPHNLYLHSSIVQTRAHDRTPEGKREAIKFATIDSTIALTIALVVNAAILVLAAAVFHVNGRTDVAEIQDAHELLAPMLGGAAASILFAVALLASGQNSTLTGTLAGQVVMEGFLRIKIKPWIRRLITRLIAVIPAVIVIAVKGEGSSTALLVLSQVVLSMQLSFAVFPLVFFTSDKAKMGAFVNSASLKVLSYCMAIIIAGLNIYLLGQTVVGWLS